MILDILEDSRLYKQIDEIVPLIGYNSCNEKDVCTNLVHIQPTDMYIAFAYPFIKFTFSFPDIIPRGSYYTFSFTLTKNITCRLLLEDKERFTRRSLIWKNEVIVNDLVDFELSRNNDSSVYEFALSLR